MKKRRSLECFANVSKQRRRTYENETVKLLLRTTKHPDPDLASQGYVLTTRFKRFNFDELRKATQGFKEVIGHGVSRTVYKGVLPDKRVAAIK